MVKNSIRALIFFLLSNSALAEINIPNVSELEMTGRINIDSDYFDGWGRYAITHFFGCKEKKVMAKDTNVKKETNK